jgi:hypothetical protein
MGYTPGVFAKSAEVVLNVGIAKMMKSESVEVAESAGLAGVRVAAGVRNEATFTFHDSMGIILCQ